MDNETSQLIEKLATKLGTTAEHLWAVLVRQAPISAVTDILQYTGVALLVWFTVWMTSKFWDDSAYDDEWIRVIIIVCWATSVILAMVAFFSFPNTVAAILNPEYWALERVLNAVKN